MTFPCSSTCSWVRVELYTGFAGATVVVVECVLISEEVVSALASELISASATALASNVFCMVVS